MNRSHRPAPRRSLLAGRVYSVAASPTAIVILRADAIWSLIEERDWGQDMRLQTMDFGRGIEIGPDIDAALEWVDTDRKGTATLITVDASASSQQVALRFDEHFRRIGDNKVMVSHTRLSARPIAPDRHEFVPDDPRNPRALGVNELAGIFNDVVSAGTTDTAHGAPIDRTGPQGGRTVISYANLAEEEPPGVNRASLDETLAMATSLRVPTTISAAGEDADLGRALGARELSAVALILAVISGRDLAPRSTSPAATPWGWGALPRPVWSA